MARRWLSVCLSHVRVRAVTDVLAEFFAGLGVTLARHAGYFSA